MVKNCTVFKGWQGTGNSQTRKSERQGVSEKWHALVVRVKSEVRKWCELGLCFDGEELRVMLYKTTTSQKPCEAPNPNHYGCIPVPSYHACYMCHTKVICVIDSLF